MIHKPFDDTSLPGTSGSRHHLKLLVYFSMAGDATPEAPGASDSAAGGPYHNSFKVFGQRYRTDLLRAARENFHRVPVSIRSVPSQKQTSLPGAFVTELSY